MKKLIFALLFLPAFAFGQIADTVFTVTVNNQLYSVTRTTSTEGFTDTYKPLVDTATAIRNTADRMVRDGKYFQSLAQQLQEADRTISLFAKLDADDVAQFGKSPLTEVMKQWDYEFLSGTWEQDVEGTITAITFARLSSGANAGRIRFTPQGSTARTVLLFGPMMRVVNWPASGKTWNLYRIREGLWSDANRKVFLRRTAR